MKRLALVPLALALVCAPATQAKPRLRSFDGCGQLVRYAKAHKRGYQPGGPPPGVMPVFARPMGGMEGDAAGAPPTAAPQATADDSSGDYSHTNNQEAGVFEPDIVKSDGKTVYAVTSAGVLNVVDVSGDAPVLRGTLALGQGYGHQMLMDRRTGRLLVSWSDYTAGGSVIGLVDVSDPAEPALLRTLSVTGDIVAERRTDRTVRVVMAVRPRAIAYPEDADADRPGAWLPKASFRSVRGGRTTTRRLAGCRQVRRPRSFSGLEQLTVLTINLDRGLDPVDADTIMTGGETVYASARNLFVATQRYHPQLDDQTSGPAPQGQSTQIHRFSLDDADNATYRGTGTVPGFMLNQFSASEEGDVLRVATTDTPPWFRGQQGDSQSYVTTLRERDDRLEQIGQVGGIGKGERIYAVRFLSDVGYVVTFQQTDPLFTVDVSDPAKPVVRGELVIPGFSDYLHPIGDGRLIGVGYGPDDEGRQGLQLSEFDVSDPSAPKLAHRTTIQDGSSTIGYDHHAFLWWAPRSLAVLPVSVYSYEQPSCAPEQPCPAYAQVKNAFSGAIGFTVKPEAITEAGRVSHTGATVSRSLVIRDVLYTLSDDGLEATTMDGYVRKGFAAFPQPQGQTGTATDDGAGTAPPAP